MGIIKRRGILLFTLFAFASAAFLGSPNTFAEDSAGKDVLHAVTMTYDQDVVDIYNNVYVVSIDDQKDITLDFDVEEGFYGVKTI
ncbi:hypothetical protein IKF86_00415, partial [Candidatus Saccharibacteria bacterium]|nr:hypothetical protein [Candidatus Saccharibacteria bacterium]